eukprot:GHVR01095995.1.p1 GENE.GHVR01095995.1~~GHVR01095995.1.p1  ORF type:complete len:190 (+),score=42.73 GHVR01095995.1:98-667(+)
MLRGFTLLTGTMKSRGSGQSGRRGGGASGSGGRFRGAGGGVNVQRGGMSRGSLTRNAQRFQGGQQSMRGGGGGSRGRGGGPQRVVGGFVRTGPVHTRSFQVRDVAGPAARGGKQQILVSHIPTNLSEQDLRDAFEVVGVVQYVSLLLDSQGRKTGKAVLRFLDSTAAQNAVANYDGGDLNGSKIVVTLD